MTGDPYRTNAYKEPPMPRPPINWELVFLLIAPVLAFPIGSLVAAALISRPASGDRSPIPRGGLEQPCRVDGTCMGALKCKLTGVFIYDYQCVP